jgi:hypothetical protein
MSTEPKYHPNYHPAYLATALRIAATQPDDSQALSTLRHLAPYAAQALEVLQEVAKSASGVGFHTLPAGHGPCKCSQCGMVHEARAALSRGDTPK